MKISAAFLTLVALSTAAAIPVENGAALSSLLDKKDEEDKWSTGGNPGKRSMNILDKKDDESKWGTTGTPGKRSMNIIDKKDVADKWSTTGNPGK